MVQNSTEQKTVTDSLIKMPKQIDYNWLKEQAIDSQAIAMIDDIRRRREYTLSRNEFSDDDELAKLTLRDHVIWLRNSAAFSSIEVYCEIFKDNNHCLVKEFEKRPALTIIDVGANEGYYAMKMAGRQSRIYCLEPNRHAFEMLRKNINENNLCGVQIFPIGAGLENTTIELQCVKQITAISGAGIRAVDRPWLKDEFVTAEKIEIVRLDDFCMEQTIEKIDILKIDVEGMELDVLAGADETLEKTCRIVIERHSEDLRNGIAEILQLRGWELVFEEDPCFENYYGDMYWQNRNMEIE